MLLVVLANGDRLVLHAYNGTQNLMVQGKNYEKFATDCLQPFFIEKINQTIDKITKFNNDVQDSLGTKKPVKNNTNKPFSCPQCNVKAKTIGDLKVHMKTCHTKPSVCSPKRSKFLRKYNEDNSFTTDSNSLMLKMDLETENEASNSKQIDQITKDNDDNSNQEFIPVVENLVMCDFCELDFNNTEDLKKHVRALHVQDVEQNYTDEKDLKSIESESITTHTPLDANIEIL